MITMQENFVFEGKWEDRLITDIYTDRLLLRKMTTEDAPSLFDIWSDPDVNKFMNIKRMTDKEQARKMIELFETLAEAKKAIRYSIFELGSNELIGSCGYNYIDFRESKTEIGYDSRRESWGKGYAPEAVLALIDYAFNTLKLQRIEAKIIPENHHSKRVLKKLDFKYEGIVSEYEKSKGRYTDFHLYSKHK